jgi:hypothetical protein
MTDRWPNLDTEKVAKMIHRALSACTAYACGEMTLKQVWHRVRGDRFNMACQMHPDRELGMELYTLNLDFYCFYGTQDEIVHEHILRIARLLESDKPKADRMH